MISCCGGKPLIIAVIILIVLIFLYKKSSSGQIKENLCLCKTNNLTPYYMSKERAHELYDSGVTEYGFYN